MNMFKGKGKGRASGFAKGKGSFQKKGKGSSSVSAALTVTGKGSSSSGPQKPGNPARTGCFICGSKNMIFERVQSMADNQLVEKEVVKSRVLETISTRLCTW